MVFDAQLLSPPLRKTNGTIWNAELTIGESSIMLGEATSAMARPGFVYVYVEDADAIYAKALAEGASPVMPVEDQFYGDRAGGVTDPCGNIWWIATHQRSLSDAELKAAAAKAEADRSS